MSKPQKTVYFHEKHEITCSTDDSTSRVPLLKNHKTFHKPHFQKSTFQNTGQRLNELENGPSSYRLKKQFYDSNRGGFGVLRDLV